MAYVDDGWDDLYITYTPMKTRALLAGIALCGLVVGACGEDPLIPGLPWDAPEERAAAAAPAAAAVQPAPRRAAAAARRPRVARACRPAEAAAPAGRARRPAARAAAVAPAAAVGRAGGSGGSGGGTATDGGTKGDAQSGSDAPPAVPGNAPYGCTGCKRIFDGQTLNGWHTAPGSWEVKEARCPAPARTATSTRRRTTAATGSSSR